MIREFSDKYLELLKGEFEGINLTRIESPEEFFQKQIRDSILPLEESEIFKKCLDNTKVMVDIGFGGGFPILPMAFMNPDKKFYGMDARAKKAQVVSQIANRLELKNVKLMHQRFEEVIFNRDAVVTFKAVGKVCDLLPLFKTNNNLFVFFYKGPNFYDLEEIEPMLNDWEVIEETSYDVPGTEGRLLLGFKNKKVLRGTKTSKNIQFSQLQ
jgi:16S rRNA (guanine527-N7)-methyltransferase